MPNHLDVVFSVHFGNLVESWGKLEGYVTDAIIRDAITRFTEFREYWENCAIEDGTAPTYAFTSAYVETVASHFIGFTLGDSVQMWTKWGKLLRELEISR